jgi:hypothetical protein
MSETIRIKTTPNGSDKYLKVKIDQEFDFIEVLSMKITQEEAYRNFCSDYGAIVGRVIINSGFGLANARVSIFLPIDDEDKNDTVIKGLYPYSIVSDKDTDGIRYNLLPKSSETNNECFTPIGTFPNKREILDNEELLHVYCKYYKFTTTTNAAGDFMMFGVPLGTYVIHVDADISDIGIASQRPYDLISQGTPSKFFDSPTKYKGGTNLDKLVQVKSTNYSVNVQPFWGEAETCEVGISRADIDMNYNIVPSAMFMGSIFGDQDKNSINKRCRPRKKLGNLCSQIAGEGSVEILRETIDGGVEQFDIDGGRLIDSDGTWAFQIPMNLDYVVTDENGKLSPSDDPNKGIPTRASVRFRIGMDNTGGEGRLRTRAKYLVPNNPINSTEIDYTFNETTKKTSFRSLYWNKIYTVSNFISRFQTAPFDKTRAITGIKDVDACEGDKTPFPYNKVNSDSNPIFFIICLIIKIIAFLIYVQNAFIIPLVNVMLKIMNAILYVICTILYAAGQFIDGIPLVSYDACKMCIADTCCNCNDILKYIPCIVINCPFGDPQEAKTFSPGCYKGGDGLDGGSAYDAAVAKYGSINCYPGDGAPYNHPKTFGDAAGLDKCIAFAMAKDLGIFQFDFYNDWVNGTLFGYLLKYKKKKRKREIFCEYDCNSDFFSQGGVDGNGNGVGDNDCRNNYLYEASYNSGSGSNPANGEDSQFATRSIGLREGLIKKIDVIKDGKKISEEFYYAATKHDVSFKLFATDIVCVGSVFDCDWQGIPKVQSLLIPTTYKLPPDTLEETESKQIETSGQCGLGGSTRGLFFEVDCLGVHSDFAQVLNIRHISEIGVDLDELRYDNSGAPIWPDNTLGIADIDESGGKWFRDVFFDLNSQMPNSVSSFPNNTIPMTTEFNLGNALTYPFASVGSNENGSDYIKFRGYPSGSDSSFNQPKHSYFFYFGLLPGKSAIDKLNQRFFTRCNPVIEKEFNVVSSSVPANPTGSITFTVISGTAPFTYTVSGPSGVSSGTFVIDPATGQPIPVTITGPQGQYSIEVIDVNGNVVTQTVNVDGPPQLYASASVTKACTSASASDGQITISNVGGGSGTYSYTLFKSNGSVERTQTFTTSPFYINTLAADIGPNAPNPPNPPTYGYYLQVSDGVTTIEFKGLLLDGPTPVVIQLNGVITPTTCWASIDGKYDLSITGGKSPYNVTTTPPIGIATNDKTSIQAMRGTYTVTAVDIYGTTANFSFNVPSTNPLMTAGDATAAELARQCDPNDYFIPFNVLAGAPVTPPAKISVQYNVNDAIDSVTNKRIYVDLLSANNYVNNTTNVFVKVPQIAGMTKLNIRFKSADGLCFSNEVKVLATQIVLPNTALSINFNGISNALQCSSSSVSFKFNVSHWYVGGAGYMDRAPYTFQYTVNGGALQTTIITSNQQLIIAPKASSSSANIVYTITDNKGCTANGSFTIATPINLLSGQVVRTNSTVGTTTTCYYKFTTSGGIGTVNATPKALNTNYISATANNLAAGTETAFCSAYPNPAVQTVAVDSIGCSTSIST